MSRQYGFYLDADGCSGCGTCVIACKDKNNLPVGGLWRRLEEREKGEGISFFAYYLSLACHHCHQPACVESCPEGALYKRKDNGLVLLEDENCSGCRLCLEACPYGALRYDREREKAGKCDGCIELVLAKEKPACVSACPLRVLDFGEMGYLKQKFPQTIGYEKPEPGTGGPLPSLLIKPHRGLE